MNMENRKKIVERIVERKYSSIFLVIGIVIILSSLIGVFSMKKESPLIHQAPLAAIDKLPSKSFSFTLPNVEPPPAPTPVEPKKLDWFDLIDKFSHIIGWIMTAASMYNLIKKKKSLIETATESV